MKNKVVVPIILIMILCIFIIDCGRTPQEVRVGYLPITLGLPFFVAMEEGYFTEAGLKIEDVKFTTADQLTNSVLAENIDITANTSISTFMTTYEKSPEFAKIYLVSYHTTENFLDALLVKKNSEIKEIKNLVGKKIGMFPGSTNIIYLSVALSNYFDPKKDVEMLQLPPQTHIEALASGQIDALYTLEPLVTVATSQGIGEILIQGSNAKYIADPFPGGAYIISTKFAKNNPKTAQKFMEAIYKAVDFIKNDEKKARSYFEKYTPIKGDISLKTHIGAWWKPDEVDKTKLQKIAVVLGKGGELKKDTNTDNYYYNK